MLQCASSIREQSQSNTTRREYRRFHDRGALDLSIASIRIASRRCGRIFPRGRARKRLKLIDKDRRERERASLCRANCHVHTHAHTPRQGSRVRATRNWIFHADLRCYMSPGPISGLRIVRARLSVASATLELSGSADR